MESKGRKMEEHENQIIFCILGLSLSKAGYIQRQWGVTHPCMGR